MSGKGERWVTSLEVNLQGVPILLIHSENLGKSGLANKNIQSVAAFSNREAFHYQSEDIFNGKDNALVFPLDMELLSPHKDRNTQLSVSHKRRSSVDEEQRRLHLEKQTSL